MFHKLLYLFFRAIEKVHWESKYKIFREKYEISPSFRFNGPGIHLTGDGKISIGAHSYVGRYSLISSQMDCVVRIGRNCAISHYFMVHTVNRLSNQRFWEDQKFEINKGNVIIGDNCWIGAYVYIKEGITIGDNVVIGAHSVVTKDIPAFTIAAGVPAKVLSRIK
jgi:maltose O-acetyltransferase